MTGLSIAELSKALTRWSYKPGWEFRIYAHPYEGPRIAITLEVPDSRDVNFNERTQCVRSALPPFTDAHRFYQWLLWRCIIIEIHEACEFGQVDGVPIVDPHSDAYANMEV